MFPLSTPQNDEEFEKNLKIIQNDLKISREQLYEIIDEFALTQNLPAYLEDLDKNYLPTIIYALTGGKSEQVLWEEQAEQLSGNLKILIEEKALTQEQILEAIQKFSQQVIAGDEPSHTFKGLDFEPEMDVLGYFVKYAIDYHKMATVLIPMMIDLIRAGQKTIADLIDYLLDSILNGLEEEDSKG